MDNSILDFFLAVMRDENPKGRERRPKVRWTFGQ